MYIIIRSYYYHYEYDHNHYHYRYHQTLPYTTTMDYHHSIYLPHTCIQPDIHKKTTTFVRICFQLSTFAGRHRCLVLKFTSPAQTTSIKLIGLCCFLRLLWYESEETGRTGSLSDCNTEQIIQLWQQRQLHVCPLFCCFWSGLVSIALIFFSSHPSLARFALFLFKFYLFCLVSFNRAFTFVASVVRLFICLCPVVMEELMQRVLEGGKAVEHPQASQTNMYPPGPETEALFAPLQKLREAVKPNEPMDLLAFKLQTCNALQRALDAKLDSKLTLPNFWKFLSLAQELARRDMAHMSLVLQVFFRSFQRKTLGRL